MSWFKFLYLYCAVLSLAGCLMPPSTQAAIYYVSPEGNDQNSGLSKADAWRTLDQVNKWTFSPGDQILLQGGRSFQGPLKLDRKDRGTAEDPIIVSSFDLETVGRATITAGIGRGIDVYNSSGLRISDLVLVGIGAKINQQSGLLLLSSHEEGASLITVERLEVYGFGKYGISIGAWKTESGYSNVRITNCSLHDNLRAGIFSWGPWGPAIYAHSEIHITDSRAYNMKGGSGMTLSSVDGGIIERCVAYNNGEEFSGAAGIWAWDSNNILFQFNESYGNRTIGVDGDGFDFDGGVTNSVMQYNYSHDNDAAGFLLAQYSYAPQAMENIVIRYNISENDCRKKNYGAIHVWNGEGADRIRNVSIYQNTVYLSPSPRPKAGPIMEPVLNFLQTLGFMPEKRNNPSAISIISPTTSISVFNNLFFTSGGETLVSVVPSQQTLLFQNNAYWSDDGPFLVEWMGTSYNSMMEWLEDAVDQERLGDRILAIHADPLLEAPGTGGTLGNADLLPTLNGYKIKTNSPLHGQGLNLVEELGIDPGSHGFFGTPFRNSTPPSIGAHLAQES